MVARRGAAMVSSARWTAKVGRREGGVSTTSGAGAPTCLRQAVGQPRRLAPHRLRGRGGYNVEAPCQRCGKDDHDRG
ncbi:hypothetical protein GUJ93_ZPchr0002g23528 [Zizania palustris]|uniref:Uncharacterized protein n=1 Tax=Zizania palustris TaxID=103762 RepID=A0A8J5VI76_ZIZPA|nr:hypothetical protein GUJ93_ZPchr0002g23528 [Zizania palustris]